MTTKNTHTSPPTSPVSPRCTNDDRLYEHEFVSTESTITMLSKLGFKRVSKITDTLQGSIWRGVRKTKSNELISFVIKITEKHLHENAQGVIDGVTYYIDENIVSERSILKRLTQDTNCPETIVRYHGFYESDAHYYLLMEDGGTSLFNFIQKVHKLIRNGNIEVNHWKQVVKVILKQMIESIQYIHSKNICHFDISLENLLINDIDVNIEHKEGQKDKLCFVLDKIRIKLCDFGLAQLFKKKQCLSNTFCGKTGYQSPEIFFKAQYDAKKNDIWAFGVCVFMMTSGVAPWNVAKCSDDAFLFVRKHSLSTLLRRWDLLYHFDDYLLYLLRAIFQDESDRITLKNIKQFVEQFM